MMYTAASSVAQVGCFLQATRQAPFFLTVASLLGDDGQICRSVRSLRGTPAGEVFIGPDVIRRTLWSANPVSVCRVAVPNYITLVRVGAADCGASIDGWTAALEVEVRRRYAHETWIGIHIVGKCSTSGSWSVTVAEPDVVGATDLGQRPRSSLTQISLT